MTSPAVTIFVTGALRLWTGEGGTWHFITIPEEQAAEVRAESLAARRGFGSVKVEATIGTIIWRTSVFPPKAAATSFRSKLRYAEMPG